MTSKTRKKSHNGRIVLLCLLAALLIFGAVFSHFGGLGPGECADTEAFAFYAKDVSELVLPEHTRIVALGEATHGNKEFQQLKRTVFQNLTERYGIRAFCLEGDYGGCEMVNRYIHGGKGSAEEAAAAIGFGIYRTEEMADLIRWMREYNETAAEGEDLVFYGFDMQRSNMDYACLKEAATKAGIDTGGLDQLWNAEAESFLETAAPEEKTSAVAKIKEQFDPSDTAGIHAADILLQNIAIFEEYNAGRNPVGMRDRFMADNILWILGQEEARGHECIFVSAHNGHVEQKGSYDMENKVMGNLLADAIGEDAYYVTGTDFRKATVNLPLQSGKRITHTFYSHDPLANAAKECGYEMCWLDFSAVSEDSPLYPAVHDYCWMGSLGDSYNALFMTFVPMSYRIYRSPAITYDSMIYVSEAHPTVIQEEPDR